MKVDWFTRAAGPRHPLRDVVLACMLVLLLAQALIGALSLSALNRLTTDNTAKRVEVLATSASARIQTGMTLGKPLAQFFGLAEILTSLEQTIPDLSGAAVMLADGQVVQAVGQRLQANGLVAALQSHAGDNIALHRGASGTVYRTGGQSIEVAVPLMRSGDSLAGALVLRVAQQGARQNALMSRNIRVLVLITLVAAVVLGLFFRFVIARHDSAAAGRLRLWVPLVVLLLAQGLYAVHTIQTFRDVWVEVTRENTQILGRGLQHDLEHVLALGISPDDLRGVEKPMSQLAASFPAIKEVRLIGADGRLLNRADAQGALPVDVPANRADDLNFPLRVHADEAALASLKIIPDKTLIAAGVRARILDALTVIAAALVVAIELLMLLTLLMGRAVNPPVKSRSTAPVDADDSSGIGAVVRPVMFGFMFAVALPLSFLPIYARSLLPMGGDVAGAALFIALPIVAEMACGLLTALAAGRLIDRRGWPLPVLAGLAVLVLGNLACAMAGSLSVFTLARGLVGLGYGLVWMGLQGFIVVRSPAAERGRNMASVIAGLFAGHLSGAAVGAMLMQQLGAAGVFIVGALLLALPAVGVLTLMWPHRHHRERRPARPPGQEAQHSWAALRHLLASRDFGLLLAGCVIPFSIAQVGLLTYALPVYMEAHGAPVASVGRVLMLYGFCVIYIGPFMGRLADRSRYKKYWIAAGGLVGSVGLLGMYFADGVFAAALAVVLLALASCLAGGAQTAYVLALRRVQDYGVGQATSVMRAADKFGQMLGPLLLGGLFTAIGIADSLATTGLLYMLATLAFMAFAPRLLPDGERGEEELERL